MNKRILLLAAISLSLLAATMSRISTKNTILWGSKTSGSNKDLCTENGNNTQRCIRYNTVSSEWEFSNDGVSFDAIGSGGGFANPMTNDGDLITQSASNPVRLGIGNEHSQLTSDGSQWIWKDSWFVHAYIDAASNISLGFIDVSSWTGVTASNLVMTVESAKGSLNAEIPCSGTNPSTGLTCSAGDEGLGVVFTVPYAPVSVEVCAFFNHRILGDNKTGSLVNFFELVETPNDSQTILQEGNSYIEHSLGGQALSNIHGSQIKLCTPFYFSTTGKKTIRLFHQVDATGATWDENAILVNSSVANSKASFLVTVLR
jgi:hypothetical protein